MQSTNPFLRISTAGLLTIVLISSSPVIFGGCRTPTYIDQTIAHPEPEIEIAVESAGDEGAVTNAVGSGECGMSPSCAAHTNGWLLGADGVVPDSTPAYQYLETELFYRGGLYRRAYMTLANSDGRQTGIQADIVICMWSPSINGAALEELSRFRVVITKVPPTGFKPSTLRCCHPRTDIGVEDLMFRWNGCLWELQSGSN